MFNSDHQYLYFMSVSLKADMLELFRRESDSDSEIKILDEAINACHRERFGLMCKMAEDLIMEEDDQVVWDLSAVIGPDRRLFVVLDMATIRTQVPWEFQIAPCVKRHGSDYADFAQNHWETRVRSRSSAR